MAVHPLNIDTSSATKVALIEQRDAALGIEVRTWEGDLGELLDMGGVLTTVLESFLGSSTPSIPFSYHLNESQVSQIFFSAYHLQEMIKKFREGFYAAVEK